MKIARDIVTILDEKKGEDILLMDVRAIFPFADYFILCSASSVRTIKALVEAALERAQQDYQLYGRVEGIPEDGWMLVDFDDIILHVFAPEQRDYYRLEELWNAGKIILKVQ